MTLGVPSVFQLGLLTSQRLSKKRKLILHHNNALTRVMWNFKVNSKQDVEGVQNMSRVYLIGPIFGATLEHLWSALLPSLSSSWGNKSYRDVWKLSTHWIRICEAFWCALKKKFNAEIAFFLRSRTRDGTEGEIFQ